MHHHLPLPTQHGSSQLQAELDPAQLVRHAVETVVRLGPWDYAGVILPSVDGQGWQILTQSPSAADSVGLSRATLAGTLDRAYHTGEAQYVPALAADEDAVLDHGGEQLGSALVLPIAFAGHVLGVMKLERAAPEALAAGDVAYAQATADLIGLALKNAWSLAQQQKEEMCHGLIDSLDNSIAAVDGEGRIRYLNEAAAVLLGGAKSALIGKTLHELLPEPAASAQLSGIRRALREDREIVFETESLPRDRPRWHRVCIRPVRSEGKLPRCALFNATDIDDLKRAESGLLQLNHALEASVQQRTAEFRDLYEHAPTGYHSLDVDGKIMQVNGTELLWLGYTRDEMIGRPLADFLTWESQSIFREHFPLIEQRGWLQDVELEFICKDGNPFPALLRATAVYDEEGNYLLSRAIVFDNAPRKKTEDELRRSQADLRAFLDTASDLIEILDASGNICYVNDAWCSALGYTPQEAAKFHALQIIDPAYHDYCRSIWITAWTTGNPQPLEVVFRTRGGGEVILEGSISVRRYRDGQAVTHAIFRDVTRRKQTEEALRIANAEMERALRTKDEFLANMSHELRTPLNAILALSESLLEETRGSLNSRQHEMLGHIESSGRHLLALINDILDLSKVEAGRLELQIAAVLASDVGRASLQFVREVALKKSLELSLQLSDESIEVAADPVRLKQMLVNLLSNAVKFTPPGGKISLEVETQPEAGCVYFSVRDTGIGIAPAQMPQLFRPFTQLDSSLSRQHEGTGLGLSLVRRLAHLHGGSVAVKSEPGQGSCFTIVLPYNPNELRELAMSEHEPGAALSPADEQLEPTQVGVRVLLAEDNEVNLEVVRDYLEEKGYAVTVARTGREAIDQADVMRPDVILMDIQMPEMDGLEAIQCLRARPGSELTPIIALTALAMPGDRERCLEAGANAYLTKPIRLKDLVSTIRGLLHQ